MSRAKLSYVITIRALATGTLAVTTMLSLQGCIGVGDSWSGDPPPARPTAATTTTAPPAPTAPPPPGSTPTAAPTGAPSATATPAPTSAPTGGATATYAATVGRVEASPAVIGNPRCGATVPPITVTAQVSGRLTGVRIEAEYNLFGTSYTGMVVMTYQAATGRATATLPPPGVQQLTDRPANVAVTVTVRDGSATPPGYTSITVGQCLGNG